MHAQSCFEKAKCFYVFIFEDVYFTSERNNPDFISIENVRRYSVCFSEILQVEIAHHDQVRHATVRVKLFVLACEARRYTLSEGSIFFLSFSILRNTGQEHRTLTVMAVTLLLDAPSWAVGS